MKKLLGIATAIMIIGTCTATEISFSPTDGNIGKGCLVATEIIIDAGDKEIAATDIIMETSLTFVDFVPSSLFPYFLPPKVEGNIIHLVGFNVDPDKRMTGKWSLWTLYMKQKNTSDANGSIKLYMNKAWDTTDSNLSVAWGVDVLDTVGIASYTFVDTGVCVHDAAEDIDGGINNKSLRMLLAKLDRDQMIQRIFNRKTLIAFAWIIIILTILALYHRTSKTWIQK